MRQAKHVRHRFNDSFVEMTEERIQGHSSEKDCIYEAVSYYMRENKVALLSYPESTFWRDKKGF
jgi:hypothetical protein